MKRTYQRISIISKLAPTMLFIKIDPEASGTCESQSEIQRKTQSITKMCLEYGIDGIVIENQSKDQNKEDQVSLI